MASLRSEVLSLFDDVGWTSNRAFVRYTAISRLVNERLKLKNEGLKRASNVERCVRKLRQEGFLESRELDGQICFRKLNGGVEWK